MTFGTGDGTTYNRTDGPMSYPVEQHQTDPRRNPFQMPGIAAPHDNATRAAYVVAGMEATKASADNRTELAQMNDSKQPDLVGRTFLRGRELPPRTNEERAVDMYAALQQMRKDDE